MLAFVAVLLTACVPESPVVTPPPEPTARPAFASDEEALAAAEEAYSRYLATIDSILSEGGDSPERLRDLVSPEIFEREAAGFATYKEREWHTVGATTFTLILQRWDDREVTVYACDDLSATDVLDSAGTSIVAAGRATQYAFEVVMHAEPPMTITSKEPWTGGNVCSN